MELENGMVVELRDEIARYIVIDKNLVGLAKSYTKEELNELNIAKVYDMRGQLDKGVKILLNTSLNYDQYLIWDEDAINKVTEFEKEFLKRLSKKFKYIARDKDGTLCVYQNKPIKRERDWVGEYERLPELSTCFEFVHFDNYYPYEIKELIGE